MESRENPTFGRKVFFLNPVFSTRNVIINKLIEDEFEVYTIDDYRDAKNVLRAYPDSICFINIDDQLSHEQWLNFILSCETDQSLKSVLLGILSSRINRADHDHFMLKAAIPAGFIMMNERLEDITETIEGILNINGAKGRRQYVRANCSSDPDAILLVHIGTKVYKMHLLDISVVGAACILAPQYKDMFQTNSVIRDVFVTLANKNFTCSVAVYAIVVNPKYCKLVLLFMQGLPFAAKKLIRSYVTAKLQLGVNEIIKENVRDTEDYSKTVETNRQTDDDAFLLDVTDDELRDEPEKQEKAVPDSAAADSVPGTISEPSFSGFTEKPEDLSITSLF
jgi:PilZ domain.